MRLPIDLALPVHCYSGPKKPDMIAWYSPEMHTLGHIEELAAVNVEEAQNLDFEFLKADAKMTPIEYDGSITKVAQDQGQSIQPQSKVVYQPLINMNLSDHSTLKTAMIEGHRLFSNSGEQFIVI